MKGAAWLPAAVARQPDRIALEAGGQAITYTELDRRAARGARRLAACGVGPGERIGLALAPGLAFVETLHACLRLGAVAVPIDLRLGAAERSAQTAGTALVVDEPLTGAEADIALSEEHAQDAIAAVVHTSGTTGAPRPVELTYGNWEASARGSAARLGIDPADRWLCTLPLSHVGGLSIVMRSAIYGTTAVVHERFEVEAVAAALDGGGITLVSLVPTMLSRLLAAGVRPGAPLRCALLGGGPLSGPLARGAAQAGFPLAQTYGLTEACSQVTTSRIGEPWTAGQPLPGTAVEIAPDGEILVAGPSVAPAAVARDGRLHTGDLGRLDPEGRLTVTGRKAEIVISGGENVAPAEVEAVLESHPAVAEAAVHGRPDPEWGETVVARVVPASGRPPTAEQLRAHCRERLAGFKVPRTIELATSLPRTAAGKLRRDLLE
ncbi:MAG: AMP-binding protein [Solirubrobacteraceae bacterium]